MASKTVVERAVVTRLSPIVVKFAQSGDEVLQITAQLDDGKRIVMREGEALFHSCGQYLRQGDVMSFEADIVPNTWLDKETGKPVCQLQYEGIQNLTVEKGAWSETAMAGLDGREAIARDKFRAPRQKDATAPPIGGPANFQAAPQGDATAVAPVAAGAGSTTQF